MQHTFRLAPTTYKTQQKRFIVVLWHDFRTIITGSENTISWNWKFCPFFDFQIKTNAQVAKVFQTPFSISATKIWRVSGCLGEKMSSDFLNFIKEISGQVLVGYTEPVDPWNYSF